MFTTHRIKTTKELLERVPEELVWETYFNREPVVGVMYTNPFRKDSNPGCCFFRGDQGYLLFHDFAVHDTFDCVGAVTRKFGISYYKALKKIIIDLKIDESKVVYAPKVQKEEEKKPEPLVQIVAKDFTQDELDWWYTFGISKSTLDFFGVYSVDKVFINKRLVSRSTVKNPIYGYVYYRTSHVKTYRPMAEKDKKWFGYVTKKDISGYDQLPFDDGPLLIITKSLKDVMCLFELGYTAIAPQSESPIIDPTIIGFLKNQFKRQLILYDNDGGFTKKEGKGKYLAMKLSEKTDIPMVIIPDGEPKDISDYYKKHGREKTLELLKTITDENNFKL